MRDAAAAAAMSDPMLNTWFRRRWAAVDLSRNNLQHAHTVEVADEIELTGLDLLQAWRRERAASANEALHRVFYLPVGSA